MSNKFKILISSLILFIASCGDNNTIFLNYQDVDGVWEKQNEVKFSFNSDKESITDISLLLRTRCLMSHTLLVFETKLHFCLF